MSEREFPSLLNQVTAAMLLNGAVFLFGLYPLVEVEPLALFGSLAVLIPLLFACFLIGLTTYIITRIAEARLVAYGLIDGHKEQFEEIVLDSDQLSPEVTSLLYTKLAETYETEESHVRANLPDFYRLVVSSVLRTEHSLSRTLMGIYIFSRGLTLISAILLLLYVGLPTRFPGAVLAVLAAGLLLISVISYRLMKTYYIYYLIADYSAA